MPRKGLDGVEFHPPNHVFIIWPVKTLSYLKKIVLRNMRLPERILIIRMAYRFLIVLPDRSCRYRVFWLSNGEHVQGMFASHGRILPDQILNTRTATPGAGPSDPAPEVDVPMMTDLVDVVPPRNISKSLSSATRILVTLRGAISDSGMMSLSPLHHGTHGGEELQHKAGRIVQGLGVRRLSGFNRQSSKRKWRKERKERKDRNKT
ncbi:hypothetical protein PIB30_021530 [Stylosanthes scabra]|uniref:Uncharacterized protein n=1 Tax=Stylosanthes scabra TaxID=79078 RepID=A0ABU6R9I7_9FABA|nr:hypothetical protein [Stylosanthes scabra]